MKMKRSRWGGVYVALQDGTQGGWALRELVNHRRKGEKKKKRKKKSVDTRVSSSWKARRVRPERKGSGSKRHEGIQERQGETTEFGRQTSNQHMGTPKPIHKKKVEGPNLEKGCCDASKKG